MSQRSDRVIQVICLVLAAILLTLCATVAGVVDTGDAAVSPTRRPIKTPTSAPTEPPLPTSAPDDYFGFLPLILKGGEYRPTSAPTETPLPQHSYPERENCRIVASPMGDLVDMCCSLYGMLCEYQPTPTP